MKISCSKITSATQGPQIERVDTSSPTFTTTPCNSLSNSVQAHIIQQTKFALPQSHTICNFQSD